MPYGGSRFNSSKVQRKINQTGRDFHVSGILETKIRWDLLLLRIWDTELAANLRARRSAISVCLGTVVTRGSARLTYLLCFAPSSARTHPNRSKCRMSSRHFTYTSSCSITILFLGSLDRSTGSRIIRTASMRFSRASSNVAPCVSAPGISSVHATQPFTVLHKTRLDFHKINLLSALILRETAWRCQEV